MTKNELNDAYFNWMCQLVFDGRYSKKLSYRRLLKVLHKIEFTYSIPMDGNRAEDGIDVIKTEARRQQAEKRRVEIERQLAGSKYGIAYTDGTERITQLNRSVENNLMKQIEYLTSMLYSQLGITQSILDGSADEKTMLNYYNRTIEPIIAAIVDELKRKFLTKTARSQKQSILFFRDPFKLVPVADLSEIADKFTRNEIMTSNEIRQIIGMKPSDDPKADELKNSNISEAKSEPSNGSYDVEPNESDAGADYDSIVNELLDGLEKEIDEIIGSYVSDDEEEP